MADKTYPFVAQPGIQSDGTKFDSRKYNDGNWCRMQRNKPRKMGGYVQKIALNNVPRGTHYVQNNSIVDSYFGHKDGLSFFSYDRNFSLQGDSPYLNDRTPEDYVASDDVLWTFDSLNKTIGFDRIIVAHPGLNLNDIENRTETQVYIGDIGGTYGKAPLSPAGISVSGGICVLYPYLFAFSNDGTVNWSAAGVPTTWYSDDNKDSGAGRQCIADQKIVAARPTRGGNYSPSGIFWSVDSIVKSYYTQDKSIFTFDTISEKSSILSSNSIISMDSMFFWAGNDRFMFYNGNVQTLPNDTNLNFFYDNLNYDYKQKVWGTYIPRFNELIWFFPKYPSTECNWMIIFNKGLNCWYNSPILRNGDNGCNRLCGYFDNFTSKPFWFDEQYGYIHEKGLNDERIDGSKYPIKSYFETPDISFCAVDPSSQWKGIDRQVRLKRVEPDFLMSGNMQLEIYGKAFAASDPILLDKSPITFNDKTEKIDLSCQSREITLKFISNEVDGDYQLGNMVLDLVLGDGRAST